MNSNLQRLQPYPFEQLAKLKNGIIPPQHLNHISLSIGEPKHPAPDFVKRVLVDSIDDISRYPTTKGTAELREVIGSWLETRFQLKPGSVNPDINILPSRTSDCIEIKYFLSVSANLALKFFCIIVSSICIPIVLGSNVIFTPVPN